MGPYGAGAGAVTGLEGKARSARQTAMDAEMASWKSTGTYIDEVPPPGANIVSGMWIFKVKRPPGSPPVFKARYVARGFSQRQGVDFFQTFSPTPKMTTLRVLLHVAAQRDYELHSLDFSITFLQGSLHEEIWLRCPPGFTGSFPVGTQWSLQRPVYGLRQAPREWHDTLRTTLAALGFAPSTADPSLFLRTDATLPPFYVLVYVDDLVFATADTEALAHVKSELQKRHTCTDLGELTSYLGLRITRDRAQRTITLTQSHMVQQSVEPSGPYPELVGCLMYLMTCTRPDLAYPLSLLARYVAPGSHRKVHWDAAKRVLRYLCSTSGMGLMLGGWARVVLTGHADASWVDDLATQRSSQGYTFSLGSGSISWRSTRSSSVLSSSCEAEIYTGAMAAQELCCLTYLLTDLGEEPRSPPVLYVNNKAMLALCQEHRMEHRTKHIALHYFLARELQQRGQLRLTYVASQANTADVFTKALQPCDHQRTHIGDEGGAHPARPYRGLREGAPHRYAGGDGERLEVATICGVQAQDNPEGRCSSRYGMDGREPRPGLDYRYGTWFEEDGIRSTTPAGNMKKPPAELVLKWIDEAWADVPEEMMRKAFLTCDISNAEDKSQDNLILTHMRDSGEVEVLEDVMEEEQDELVPNPFYPAPVVTPPNVIVEMEEEAVLAAEAEEGDEEAVPAKSDSSESDDGNANEGDEWSDEGDEWWAPGRNEGAAVEEWVAGDEDE
ncbi:unnamed protein product [Closterium sp. NIES-53]